MVVPTPIIPESSQFNYATLVLSAVLVLDIAAEIGEYFRALEASAHWTYSSRRLKEGRDAVTQAALHSIAFSSVFTFITATIVTLCTRDMDWRMIHVLEGSSRILAALTLAWSSVKIPRLVGIYYTASRETHIHFVGCGNPKVLRFHVSYSILQYFLFILCVLLPFCGRPTSVVLGISFGFNVSLLVYIARRAKSRMQVKMSMSMAAFFALSSSILFADGCHYIQTVWGRGWQNEWGLGLISFLTWSFFIIVFHYRNYFLTERMVVKKRRFSYHDRNERVAISLILSNVFHKGPGARNEILTKNELERIAKEVEEEEAERTESERSTCMREEDQTIWALLKMRFFGPSDLVFMTKVDRYLVYFLSVFSLFVVVVNIGATSQMKEVRKNFHHVHETLYGAMDQGPVCAFDKVGGSITTFSSANDAHQAKHTIAHCGACGACSDWHNLRLQYKTRSYLAKASARCGRLSLLGGRSAVLECLNSDPIGFQGECAECWADDIFCARSHCAFIFLQSNLINTVSNFQVGAETITAATCEEAMCELEFVPCSGANRRRMNITSSIRRPGQQLCSIMDVSDWADIFPEESLDSSSDSASGDGGKGEL